MKPRSLFDDPEAWVRAEFKPKLRPQAPIVHRPKVAPKSKRPEPPKPAPVAKPTPAPVPYGPSLSPSVRSIIEMVARVSGQPVHEIRGKSRERRLFEPRHVIMFLAYKLTDRSLPLIGRELGGKDHTSVIHAIKKIERLIEERIILLPESASPEDWAVILLAEMKAIRHETARAFAERQKAARDQKYARQKEKRARARAGREAARCGSS